MTRVLFWVQHVKGVGHVYRTNRIISAMKADGFDVTVVNGGMPITNFAFDAKSVVQLEPVKAAKGSFKDLIDATGAPMTDALKAARAQKLCAALADVAPDIVMTETFPFGRRNFRFELLPFLKAAQAMQPRPMIAASVRDILQAPSARERAQAQVQFFKDYFDVLLVHADPKLAQVTASFPELEAIADRTVTTGLVVPQLPAQPVPDSERADVIVSVGGGAFGHEVFTAAIAAKPMTKLADAKWLLLAGTNTPADIFAALQTQCQAAGIRLETHLRDLANAMRSARVSVQMSGYNTIADAFVAGCRIVAVPFEDGHETEQYERAQRLAAHSLAEVIRLRDLTTQRLAKAIDTAIDRPPPGLELNLDGARTTARVMRERYEQFRMSSASGS